MMWRTGKFVALWSAAIGVVEAFVDYGNVYPTAYTLGQNLNIEDASRYTGDCITLSPANPFLTLDYGTESAGFPFFEVKSLSGPTQIEVKYSEEFPALAGPQSDGPWVFTIGLSNTFRIETFNVTETGKFVSFFLQGGQRWSTIRLLTNTTIEFSSLGFNSTAAHVRATEVPGQLSTSNEIYNKIWDLGARVVQAACIDAGNAVSTWKLTSEGALVPGQATAQSTVGQDFSNYTLKFRTKIVRASTGWRVASAQNPFGPYFVLTSNYPAGSTFVNVNKTLLPANTLAFAYGTSLVQQETVRSGPVHYFPVDVTVEEGTWYNISTTIAPDAYIVSINGEVIASIPIAESLELADSGFPGTGSAYLGSWGFGGFQDSAAYYTDVHVVAQNGSVLYENNLTSDSILSDYKQADLDTSVCLDGAKRDRLVWIGDFYHTVSVVASSTLRYDYILGTFEYIFARQNPVAPLKGLVPISPYLGSSPEDSMKTDRYSGLLDYQDLFLSGIGDYYRYSGRADNLKPLWDQIKALANARMEFIDPSTGLIAGSPEQQQASYFLGPANGSAVTGLSAYALQGLAPLAEALGDGDAAQLYSATSTKLQQALNDQLWNDTLGTYSLATSAPANFSLTGIAWAILSGAANSTQAKLSIAKLEELRCGVGYKTSSGEICNDEYELAPNPNGMLLDALFKAHRDLGVESLTAARTELDSFWSVMVTQEEYYSGASWEYTHPDGSPGIERFTSLAHPWGAAPTYVLPKYVLGIAATSAGFKTWTFTPLVEGLGLTEANGTVVTPYGNIEAKWKVEGKTTVLSVNVPKGTTGTIVVPKHCTARYAGKTHRGGRVGLKGGQRANVHVDGWVA